MDKLNQKDHNDTVHAHGVFCGSIRFPQNVGDDDWADKTILIPTSDSGDGSLNRYFYKEFIRKYICKIERLLSRIV